jgi:hypothetical protein
MNAFEEQFLRCRSAGFGPADLFMCSGPDHVLEPYSSVMVSSIVEYRATDIADAIAGAPGTVPLRKAEAESVWRWGRNGRFIEISVDGDNTTEEGVWLASPLTLDCTFSDLVEFWRKLAQSHPAVYLHAPSCRMYTPCSFLEEAAVGQLRGAFRSGDAATRDRAVREFRHYRSLHGQPRLWRPYWQQKTPHMSKTLFDLSPPVVPIKCKDFWRGNDWLSRMDQFDREAHDRGLPYFAHPAGEWAGGKYKSGFIVWVAQGQEDVGREIGRSLGVLVDDP